MRNLTKTKSYMSSEIDRKTFTQKFGEFWQAIFAVETEMLIYVHILRNLSYIEELILHKNKFQKSELHE